MGVVYEARQRSMNRTVALKMIHGGSWASPADVQRFRNEVESIARLAHPHIVPIFEVGETQGHHYYSMPLMGGGSLSVRLEALRGDRKAVARLMVAIAEAVEYAHRRGVIHRDLKPSNILLDDAHRPHVSDFGLSRRIGEDSSLTATGAILGSPPYMAPEQAAGRAREVTTATDVYGLGAILYTLLTGRPPFVGPFPLDILEKVRQREPDRPRSIDRRVDADLETICLKCLEKEPNRRYTGASALADDLTRWLEGRTILARRSGIARRLMKWTRRNPAVAAFATILAVAAPTAYVLTYAAYRESERKRAESEADRYQTRVALAERELFVGNADRAEDLLLGCPEPLRGWEWRVLRQRSRRNPVSLRTPGDQALCVAFSPDGQRVAVGNHTPFVRIWDATTGRDVARYPTKLQDTCGLAYSPDGLRLVATSMRGCLEAWDTRDGTPAWRVEDGPASWTVSFSPDGRTLATSGFDHSIRLRDPATGGELRTIAGHADRVTGVSFRPDGRRFASSSDDGTIKVWDLASPEPLATFREPASLPLRRVEYSPDGRLVAAGNVVGAVLVWDAETGREVVHKDQHLNEVSDVAFSPDGKLLASAGVDATVRLSDPTDGRELITLRGHQANVFGLAFSPDGTRLASAGWDGQVRIWDASPWNAAPEGQARVLGKVNGVSDDVAFAPDGRLVAATGRDQFLTMFDVETGRKMGQLDAGVGPLRCVAFSPDGRHAAAAGFGRKIRILDLDRGRGSETLEGHLRTVYRLAFHPNGTLLASGGEDRSLIVWDLVKGAVAFRIRCEEGFIRDIAFSPDGAYVAAATTEFAYVVDLESRTLLVKLSPGKGVINGLEFSPDHSRLALAGQNRAVALFRTSDWSKEREISRPGVELTDVAFSPDGRHVAASGTDRLVQIWEVDGGRELITLRDCVAEVRRLAYSSDGSRLAAVGGDRSIRIWDLRTEPFAAGLAAAGTPPSPQDRASPGRPGP